MIATILPSSANFHAVAYNEKKVAKGVARLLEMSNLGHIGVLSKPTAKEMQDYMIAYSSRNSRIKKAQFHLAISCKGHERQRKNYCNSPTNISRKWAMGTKVSRCWYMLIPTLTTRIYI